MSELRNPSYPILTTAVAERGPNVIGATGGSGTRIVARILRLAGMYTGKELNAYEDALPFGAYSDRWINRYLETGGRPPASMETEMTEDFRSLLLDHCSELPQDAPRWGWKEPRSIYLVPFYKTVMPTLRFLHFVRDGRDMAFSDNQQQLKKHGRAALEGRGGWRTPVRSIALWNRINLMAADYGERELGSDYLRVRFEDLCADPEAIITGIFEFFGLQGDVQAAAAEVRPPDTIGRWRERPARVVARLEREAEPGLLRFGYNPPV